MKKRAISLLLSLILIFAVLLPGNAANAQNGSDETADSGMVVNKTATENNDGSYTIELEAYATGEKVITQITEDIPTDIVLVLDQSGSMANCIVCGGTMYGYNDTHNVYAEATSVSTNQTYYIKDGNTYTAVTYCDGYHFGGRCDGGSGWYTGWQSSSHTAQNRITPKTSDNPDGTQFYKVTGQEACSSRLAALRTAVTGFANAVAEKAKGKDGASGTDDDVDHRIAVVGFASGDEWRGDDYNYGNTEVFVGSSQYKYGTKAQGVYGSAFQNMTTEQGKSNVSASIGALAADGGTLTNLGMEMANGIFAANPIPAGEKRNRVIVVFTDGQPGWSGYEDDVASAAISQAQSAKNSGTTVYAVGIFAGADATSAGGIATDEQKSNWFMQNLSSNNGTPQDPSYYLSAGDSASLKNIFQQISEQIETGGSSTTLGSETVIKDIIAPAFALPAGTTASAIQIDTYDCTGKNGETYTWSSASGGNGGATATVNGDQVSVTGFDFSENWCGTETGVQGAPTVRGKKLVIRFTVNLKEGFLGGNNVYTNAGAGVFEDGTAADPVLTFPQPQVNVPIGDVTVVAKDKNVYLLGGLTAAQLKSGATVTCGGVTLDLSADNFGLAEWQKAYVDISVAVTDAGGNTVTDMSSLTDDTTYTVSVTVKPNSDGSGASGTPNPMADKTGSDDAAINVFAPEVTCTDSTVYYGDNAPSDFDGNVGTPVWKHNGTLDSAVTMTGDAPTLNLTCTPDAGAFNDGKVNTKQDIAVDVTAAIGGTDVTGETTFLHTDCAGKTCTVPEGKELLLHVQTCSLTITKTGGNDGEPYVFTVLKDDVAYTEVTVVGNNSETIHELPVGTYTIEEDTGWSWRFTPSFSQAVTLSKDKPSDTITCTNTANNNKWLNGFSTVMKNIFGVSTVVEGGD